MAHTNIDVDESKTHKIFIHHLEAFSDGIDEIMADYSENSVVATPSAIYVGKAEISAFFQKFLSNATPEFWAAFKIETQYIKGDIAYLTWSAPPFIPMATDTLLIRDQCIWVQTFTAFE